MKILIIYLFATLFISCFTTQKKTQSELKVINVMDVTVVKDSVKFLKNDSSGFNIAYYGDYEIYEYPIINYVQDSSKVIGGVLHLTSRESRDTIFNYFVTKTGSNKVFRYESINNKSHTVVSRDSLLKQFNIDSLNLLVLNLELGSPHKTIRNKKTNITESECFVDNNPIDETYADTIYRYYNVKLKDIKFSWSPSLDKIKQSKLAFTRFITLPRKLKQKDGRIKVTPYMEDSFMMRPTRTKREDIYMALIERFEKDSEN